MQYPMLAYIWQTIPKRPAWSKSFVRSFFLQAGVQPTLDPSAETYRFNLFRLCWKDRSTCSIRQFAGVDGALHARCGALPTRACALAGTFVHM